jgi:NAD(P)-dependent dehydrogenase (short-subunit alcohol dehydrogenase family)
LDLDLSGRVILITGGSDGLGAATARSLVKEGALVAICARGAERLEDMATLLRKEGGDVLASTADVTDPAQLERFVQAALDRWGRIDGLVNNAGASAAGEFTALTDEQWHRDLDLKLFAAIRTSRLAFDSLARSGSGSVVNVLNTHAKSPREGTAPTSITRAAGLALTKVLSREWGPKSIRVNAVLVGVIDSGQWRRRAQQQDRSREEIFKAAVRSNQIPLGRVGRPEEFADVVTFLLSARSSYISGVALNIDGGASPVV